MTTGPCLKLNPTHCWAFSIHFTAHWPTDWIPVVPLTSTLWRVPFFFRNQRDNVRSGNINIGWSVSRDFSMICGLVLLFDEGEYIPNYNDAEKNHFTCTHFLTRYTMFFIAFFNLYEFVVHCHTLEAIQYKKGWENLFCPNATSWTTMW